MSNSNIEPNRTTATPDAQTSTESAEISALIAMKILKGDKYKHDRQFSVVFKFI